MLLPMSVPSKYVTNSFILLRKTVDRAQKKGGQKTSDKKRIKQSSNTTTISMEKKVPKKLEDTTEDKQKYDKKTKRGERMEVKKDEQNAESQQAKMIKEKGKELGIKEDARMKPGEKKDKETTEKQEEERSIDDTKKNKQEEKNERKIIGKIVKASAGQKAKVQMKTIIGGVIKAAEVEEGKKNTEESNREKSNEAETKGRGSLEEKNAERSSEVEGKSNKGKTSNVARKEKLPIVEKDKRMKRSYEGLEKDSATSSGKKNENKAGNEATAVKRVREEEKKGKPERESHLKEEPKADDKVPTQSEGNGSKVATAQTSVLERTSDKTSETEQEQPDGCGKEEDEADEKNSDSSDGEKVKMQKKSSSMTLTDSTLHRIHGDIRISLKTDNPVRALFTL